MAAEHALTNKVPLTVFKAEWGLYGAKAGPMRNAKIVARCHKVLAFPSRRGKGTQDTVRKAAKAGKAVLEVWVD